VNNFKKYINLFIFLAFASPAAADVTGIDAFLREGIGARAQGMGGAQAAMDSDLSHLFWNPAGLATLSGPSLLGQWSPSPLETSSLMAAYGQPLGPVVGALGWTENRSADIELTDGAGAVTGHRDFSNRQVSFSVANASLSPYISQGLSIKYIQTRFKPYEASGLGFDLGVQGRWRFLRAGVNWQDVGDTRLSGDGYAGGNVEEAIPSRLRAGIALALKPGPLQRPAKVFPIGVSFNLAADALMPLRSGRDRTVYNYGSEMWFEERLALRAGWNDDQGLAFGLSLKAAWLRFDYALLLSEEFSPVSRFTTNIFFAGNKP